MDQVFHHLELVEKDYFGLQYAENGSQSTNCPNPDVMVRKLVFCRIFFSFIQKFLLFKQRWLDPSKPVKKQLKSKGNKTKNIHFNVKLHINLFK